LSYWGLYKNYSIEKSWPPDVFVRSRCNGAKRPKGYVEGRGPGGLTPVGLARGAISIDGFKRSLPPSARSESLAARGGGLAMTSQESRQR